MFGLEKLSERSLVSLLIPAFNEGRLFRQNVELIERHVRAREAEYRFELIIINDGSSDNTADLAEEFARGREDLVRVIHHSKNGGLGAALRTGFKAAKGDIVIPLDIDLSYSVDHIDRLLAAQRECGAELVLLSPYMRAGKVSQVPLHRLLFSRSANTILSWALGRRLHTSTGMVRSYSRGLLERLSLYSSGMEINLEALHKSILAGARVKLCGIRPQEAALRVSPRKLARQLLLVMHYAWLFRRVRPLAMKGVIP